VVGISTSKFSFFGSKEYVEIPWECVTKVGTNVIVISADEEKIKRARA
jgi:sporulation protein YlmC with PRC-barrel domain